MDENEISYEKRYNIYFKNKGTINYYAYLDVDVALSCHVIERMYQDLMLE